MAMYHGASRTLQDRFDTRRLADRLEEVIVHDVFSSHDRASIESRDMFFLATVDPEGHPNVSYKGGDPGFVRVIDEHTLAFPNYDGIGMYLSMGNAMATGKVGMLFIDSEGRNRMRVNGGATIDFDDPLASSWPEAQFVVRVRATEIFPNCPRSSTGTPRRRRPLSWHARTARRRCRRGSIRIGRSTSSRRTTRRWTRVPR